MIWRIVSRFAELTGEPQTMPPSVIYAMLDGLFQFSAMRKPLPRCRPTFGWWSRLLALCDELDDWANQTNYEPFAGVSR